MLVVLGGLPGTGKTTIARGLAARLGAAHVRIDAIESAMWRAGIGPEQPTGIGSYVVAEAVAESCLGWADIAAREYEPWHAPRLVVDTREALAACLARIEEYVGA